MNEFLLIAAATFLGGLGVAVTLKVWLSARQRCKWFITSLARVTSSEITKLTQWRISVYRLDSQAKDSSHLISKECLQFSDLSMEARRKIRLFDLPKEEKQVLLNQVVFPKMLNKEHSGTLFVSDSNGRSSLRRTVKLIAPSDHYYINVRQGEVDIEFTVEFQEPGEEILIDSDRLVWFRANEGWEMSGKPKGSSSVIPGKQQLGFIVDYFVFDGLTIYFKVPWESN